MNVSDVIDLQVEAYNAHNLEKFCSWYVEGIEVWNLGEARPFIASMAELRAVYGKKFENPELHTQIVNRIAMGRYVVDHERITGVGAQPAEATVVYEVEGELIRRVYIMRK
jgi:hypothetical protein